MSPDGRIFHRMNNPLDKSQLKSSVPGLHDPEPLIFHTANTVYQKFESNIPRNETVQPHSQFLHTCICEQFIFFHDWSTYFAGFYILIRRECRLYSAPARLSYTVNTTETKRPETKCPRMGESFIVLPVLWINQSWNQVFLGYTIAGPLIVHIANTVYRKSETNIPRNETAQHIFPISTFMYLWTIYIFLQSVRLFLLQHNNELIVGIYKLLTDWKLGTRPHSFISEKT